MFDLHNEDIDFNTLLDDLSDNLTTTSEDTSSLDGDFIAKKTTAVRHSGTSSSGVVKKPRRNRYNPTPEPEIASISKPMMLKTDIRRSYLSMLANVVNSGEFSLLFGFMDTFFLPNFEQHLVKHTPVTPEPFTVIQKGIQQVATMWYSMVNLNPDPVVALMDSKVHLISNSPTAKLVSQYCFTATCIYDFEPYHQNPCGPDVFSKGIKISTNISENSTNNSYNSNNNNNNNSNKVGSKRRSEDLPANFDMMEAIQTSVEKMKETLPLRQEPVNIHSVGSIILHTDENKFITRLEMNMVNKHQC